MTQDSISFLEAQVKVDRDVHYSPGLRQWIGGIIEFKWQGHLQSQWISSQAIHEPFKLEKKEINLLEPQKA